MSITWTTPEGLEVTGLFVLERRSFFLENSWLASKLFQHWTFLLMINDWKQSEKKTMLIHVKVAVSHHSRCWSWSFFIYMKKTAIDFPLGGNCTSSWGTETRFANNTTPCVGVLTQTSEANKNSLLRLADRNLGVARSTLCWGICWVSRLLPFAGCLHLVLFVALHFLQPVQ